MFLQLPPEAPSREGRRTVTNASQAGKGALLSASCEADLLVVDVEYVVGKDMATSACVAFTKR